jgi:uncharacterized protein YjbI with pentapeptide repeats
MKTVKLSPRRWLTRSRMMVTLALLGTACEAPSDIDGEIDTTTQEVQGENLSGANLSGVNLSGVNLSGVNLSGANLGGTNLSGVNLSGVNLSGTNLAGNNLAGNNLSGSNLSGVNLAGVNLSGVNLSGVNLSGSNLSGSNLSGTNLSGNNLSGTNLSGTNLSGVNSGANIHSLSGSVGMLYSREDVWTPKTGACVVMGIGSTSFAKLLGQNVTSPKINVALGKLPWGFASTSGGAKTLNAWEAIVWGDSTYCVFVMAADPSVTWPGVAGFIKAIFRWNAPTTQSMDISGIEAAGQAPVSDGTTPTTITTYTGMMDAAAKFRAGTLDEKGFMAGELAFATATTNNQSVLVDFSAWTTDASGNALVLGQVQASPAPTYAEALYIALDNGDGTVQVIIDDAASRTKVMPSTMANSVVDLNVAFLASQPGGGGGRKPIPRRCGGALFLNTWFGEPVPAGKCDSGLTWSPGFCIKGSDPWSKKSGTTGPMNDYMQLTKNGKTYQRAAMSSGNCGTMKTVISETYVHMWEKSFDYATGSCTAETDTAFCARWAKNCGSVTGTDNCGTTRTVSCGTCSGGLTCGGGGNPNVCGASNTQSYEGEAVGNTLAGQTSSSVCPEAYNKMLTGTDPGTIVGACSGGAKVRWIGNSSANAVTINNVSASYSGTHTLTVYGYTLDPRSFSIQVNGGTVQTLTLDGVAWNTVTAAPIAVTLTAGTTNTIKLFNNTAWAPELDRVTITAGAGPPVLTVYDTANASAWSVKSNFQIGSGGAKPWPSDYASTYVSAWNSSLNNLIGKTWIAVKNASKAYTGGPQAQIALTTTSNLYMVVDDRWGAPPSIPYAWSAGWTDTGYNVTIKEGGTTDRTFSVYKKTGVTGNQALPKIGANNAFNYFIIIE